MKKAINGYTKESMKDVVEQKFKGQAVDPINGICKYLTTDGKKCIVGCFIPDDHPIFTENQGFDKNAVGLMESFPDLKKKMPLDEKDLISFQDFHDNLNSSSPIECQKQELFDWIDNNIE